MAASEASEAKRVAILEAAKDVFLRYGFKKTSMEDVAREAGLSRQGLYLHFPTKEALFQAGVRHLAEHTRQAGLAELQRAGLGIEERLTAAFLAMHGAAIGQLAGEHMDELHAASRELLGPVLAEQERGSVADVAAALTDAGLASAGGLDAEQTAELLFSASIGIKHRVASKEAYLDRMRQAVRLVLLGAGLPR